MTLSWVIWAFTLPILKFCTVQGEREHVDVGALGLEGIGAADIQMGGIVWLKEADEVEAFGLVALPFLGTFNFLLSWSLPRDLSPLLAAPEPLH